MQGQHQGVVVKAIWVTLVLATLVALALERWATAFVALATLGASFAPMILAAQMRIQLPVPFLSFTVMFLFATLFLGEAADFYERYWWWDVALHASSAMGFGLIGFVFVLFLFEGDRFAAPAMALALIAWTFAIAIGTIWEIFEFAMDQIFGLNMQKSGLLDTMWDLIVDVAGGFVGAASGYLYLRGREKGGLLAWVIADFVRLNRRLFRRDRR